MVESKSVEESANAVEEELISNNLVSWWCIKLASLRVCDTELTSSMPSLEKGKRLRND